jgi:hypothetical protein
MWWRTYRRLCEEAQRAEARTSPPELSARTGAAAFVGRNDLDEAMQEAFEDSKTGYKLGFTLDANATPESTASNIRLRLRASGCAIARVISCPTDAECSR